MAVSSRRYDTMLLKLCLLSTDGSALTCTKRRLSVPLNTVCDFQRCQLDTNTPCVVQAEKAILEAQVATLQVWSSIHCTFDSMKMSV